MRRSEWHNVTAGSKDLTWDDEYSETRRNPKKAVNMAARSINLSSYSNVDVDRLVRRMKRIVGVMGSRLGLENLWACTRLMPFIRRWSLRNAVNSVS